MSLCPYQMPHCAAHFWQQAYEFSFKWQVIHIDSGGWLAWCKFNFFKISGQPIEKLTSKDIDQFLRGWFSPFQNGLIDYSRNIFSDLIWYFVKIVIFLKKCRYFIRWKLVENYQTLMNLGGGGKSTSIFF